MQLVLPLLLFLLLLPLHHLFLLPFPTWLIVRWYVWVEVIVVVLRVLIQSLV